MWPVFHVICINNLLQYRDYEEDIDKIWQISYIACYAYTSLNHVRKLLQHCYSGWACDVANSHWCCFVFNLHSGHLFILRKLRAAMFFLCQMVNSHKRRAHWNNSLNVTMKPMEWCRSKAASQEGLEQKLEELHSLPQKEERWKYLR